MKIGYLFSENKIDAQIRNPIGYFLITTLIVLILYNIYYLIIGIDNPMLDMFGFRQTQTALSAFWMAQDGLKLNYETPVLGSPWQIPLEFPLYQWIVALGAKTGIPLGIAGRLVSFMFHIGSLIPLIILLTALQIKVRTILIICSLFLASPLYIFWGRSVMIESCALFFSLLWLTLLERYLRTNSILSVVGTVVAGSFAVLVKVTTFLSFGLLGGAMVIVAAANVYRSGIYAGQFKRLGLAAFAGLVPLIVELFWLYYSDEIKLANSFGSRLTSQALIGWNFGPLPLRVSLQFWQDAIVLRAVPEILGYGGILCFLIVGAWLKSRRHLWLILGAAIGFLAPLLIFTNLHRHHNYYQYANAIFLLALIGFMIAGLLENGRRALAVVAFIGIVVGQIWYFERNLAHFFRDDLRKRSMYLVGQLVKESTTPSEGLLIFGGDWSSEIPYYSERRSLAVPGWTSAELFLRLIESPHVFFGDTQIGAVVACYRDRYGSRAGLIDDFLAVRTELGTVGPCTVYSGKPS